MKDKPITAPCGPLGQEIKAAQFGIQECIECGGESAFPQYAPFCCVQCEIKLTKRADLQKDYKDTLTKAQVDLKTVPSLNKDNDPINPNHYKSHPSGVECITVTEHFNFNVGNAIKYLWRAGLKGNAVQDMEKAIWYIKREIERVKKAAEKGNQYGNL
jgi:endogenous inhibitor of DNA gyrase (YacG/DUF329 family)